jgi:fluoride ion exporter CrcB/FEX
VGQDALKTILALSLGAALLGVYSIGIVIAYGGCRNFRRVVAADHHRVLQGTDHFSTFSAASDALLQQARTITPASAVAVHVIGSVVMTFVGIGSLRVGQRQLKNQEVRCKATN